MIACSLAHYPVTSCPTLFSNNFLSCDGSGDTQCYYVRKAILGCTKTYCYLSRRKSDFRIAQEVELKLIPSNGTQKQFCCFVADLASISDVDVLT
ncbi:hypothetical protein LZ31DRAFT_384194 [Colletotrichum somersetense]|nr:hypothetical protein LZ31DRAFT_384194 [Colletotrichum somersetense]